MTEVGERSSEAVGLSYARPGSGQALEQCDVQCENVCSNTRDISRAADRAFGSGDAVVQGSGADARRFERSTQSEDSRSDLRHPELQELDQAETTHARKVGWVRVRACWSRRALFVQFCHLPPEARG